MRKKTDRDAFGLLVQKTGFCGVGLVYLQCWLVLRGLCWKSTESRIFDKNMFARSRLNYVEAVGAVCT